jgi:hypothetical protein
MAALEKLLGRELGLMQLGIEGRVHAAPEIGQHRGVEIFGAAHRRHRGGDPRELRLGRKGNGGFVLTLGEPGQRAQRRHEMRGELAPKRQLHRKAGPDLAGTELQQAVAGPACESLLDPCAGRGLERQRFVRRAEMEGAVGGEDGSECGHRANSTTRGFLHRSCLNGISFAPVSEIWEWDRQKNEPRSWTGQYPLGLSFPGSPSCGFTCCWQLFCIRSRRELSVGRLRSCCSRFSSSSSRSS